MELNPIYAVNMYNNCRFPGIVWSGEQANETRNQAFKGYESKRGKEGYTSVYVQLLLDSLSWNSQMFQFYTNPLNNDKLKQCQFSRELMDFMEDIEIKTKTIGNMGDIIRKKGVFEFIECSKKLVDDISLETAKKQCLELGERTSKGKTAFYRNYNRLIHKYCSENSKEGSAFLKKDIHLNKIKQLIYDDLPEKQIVKIVNSWGYYFK